MDSINKLTEYFTKFPGVGPRQARRMVFYLLRQRRDTVQDMTTLMTDLKKNVATCTSCYRHFVPHQSAQRELCTVCADSNRTKDTLMVVEKDVDFENIEKSGVYLGKYFILGGTYSPLAKEPERFIRNEELLRIVAERAAELDEIILALSVNPDGEETTHFLVEKLKPLTEEHSININLLGRGLSTGSELEYADPDTIKNAFNSRG